MKKSLSKAMIRLTFKPIEGISWKEYEEIMEDQWLSREELEKKQLKKLKALLAHAYENVKFYREHFKKAGFNPDDLKKISDIRKIPPITKDDFRKAPLKDMMARNIPKWRFSYNTTSGTTGSPFEYYDDRIGLGYEKAYLSRSMQWTGWKPGDRCVSLYAFKDKTTLKRTAYNVYKDIVYRQLTFSIQDFEDDAKRKKAIDRILKHKPTVIRGLVSPVVNMAHYIQDHKLEFPDTAVITYGETLTDDYRKLISRNITKSIFNEYGTTECRNVAVECEKHEGLHIIESNIVQIEKDGKEVGSGQTGYLILTDLENYSMPFIRYQVGDIAVKTSRKCSCGRNLPLIKSVQGRISEHVKTKDGRIFGLYYFTHFFGDLQSKHIEKFKVVQESLNELNIFIVPKHRFSPEYKTFLKNHIEKTLKHSITVNIKIINSIVTGKKSRLVESKVKW